MKTIFVDFFLPYFVFELSKFYRNIGISYRSHLGSKFTRKTMYDSTTNFIRNVLKLIKNIIIWQIASI